MYYNLLSLKRILQLSKTIKIFKLEVFLTWLKKILKYTRLFDKITDTTSTVKELKTICSYNSNKNKY